MKPSESRRHANRYCRYHRDFGHDTDDCFQLKDEIEALIRRGRLDKFVRRPPAEEKRPDRPRLAEPAEDNRPVAGTINTISGQPPQASSSQQPSRSPKQQSKRPRSEDIITFSDQDLGNVRVPHHDPVVISLIIAKYDVKRVLVDNGSSADVLFYEAYLKMRLARDQLQEMNSPLVGFTGDSVPVEGTIRLPVTAGTPPRDSTVLLDLFVVRAPSAYNAILGRPGLNALRAVVSTYHLLLRFPTEQGIGEVRGNQIVARECFSAERRGRYPAKVPTPTSSAEVLDARDKHKLQHGEPGESLEILPLSPDRPDQTVRIGAGLTGETKRQVVDLLRANADLFAWAPADMLGVDPEVALHHLNVDPARKPIRQKRRPQGPERQQAIAEEVGKLLEAGFIREVDYPEWLANVVLVKKHSGKWRMCVDYTDLNDACPKDSFPLPSIDQLVDATAGHQLLTFMDAFSGYNQIQMAPEDEEVEREKEREEKIKREGERERERERGLPLFHFEVAYEP